MKKVGGPVLFAVLLAGVFYVYVPFCLQKMSLDDLRNYFIIANAFTTLLIGLSGLGIGAYYYYDKEKRRPKLQFLLDELNSYDLLLVDLFAQNFSNGTELNSLRTKIGRRFEMAEMILSSSYKTLGFSDEDLRTVLKVNSFVDKSEVLMRTPIEQLTKVNLLQSQDSYIELIKSAKWVCIKHHR